MGNYIFILSLLCFSLSSHAEIKIVEVANDKAVIQFDKEDEITGQSILIKKNLSLGSCPTPLQEDTKNDKVSICPSCKECSAIQMPLVTQNRTHLIGGYLNAFETKYKIKDSGNVAKEKLETTEVDLSYLYNFEKFALGASYGYMRTKQDESDSITSSIDLIGRYFFIENKSPNMFIPFVELNLTVANSSAASPDYTGLLEGRFKGAQIAVGFSYFLNDFGFFDARYVFGNLNGDYTLESNTVDAELTGNGLALGFGIAFN